MPQKYFWLGVLVGKYNNILSPNLAKVAAYIIYAKIDVNCCSFNPFAYWLGGMVAGRPDSACLAFSGPTHQCFTQGRVWHNQCKIYVSNMRRTLGTHLL